MEPGSQEVPSRGDPLSLRGAVLEGKYEVLSCLGEGGMGAVYEARHTVIGRRVAVKFLHARFAEDPQALQRFYQEAQIAGSLGHDNICEVTDLGQTAEGLPFMVMPLLSGRTLAEEIQASSRLLATKRVLDIVSQVLLALDAAHSAGVVHRDLKPENIFLTRVGDREDFVKILDFGISKVLGGAYPKLGGLTATGMVIGTPYYMSPEQAQGASDVDQRADIYATGVLLYELVTGEHPFEAENYNELIVKIITQPVVPPSSINPAVNSAQEKVVLRAMHRDPAERFETARQFRSALLGCARQTGMSLPGYLLGDGDEARERPAAKASTDKGSGVATSELWAAVAAGKRRWAWAAAAVAAASAATLGLLLLRGGHEVDAQHKPDAPRQLRPRTGTRVTRAQGQETARPPARRTSASAVTIRFSGLPPGTRVKLGGRPLAGGIARLPRSSTPVPFRAQAPDGQIASGVVTPDRDRTVRLELQAPRPSMRAEAGRQRSTPAPRHPETTRPKHARPGTRLVSRRPPSRRHTIIRGRGGTFVKGDYDNE